MGYFADVKYGRFKVLLTGTYVMLASVIPFVISGVLLFIHFHAFNVVTYILLAVIVVSIFSYLVGYVLFTTTVI